MSGGDIKKVLFFGINTPGHRNTLLSIADKLKEDYGYRTIFLILGPSMDNAIESHGHELIALDEAGSLEVIEDEEQTVDVNQKNGKENGRKKVKLTGFMKWEYLIRKNLGGYTPDPLKKFSEAMGYFRSVVQAELIDNHDSLTAAIQQINPDLVIVDVFMVPAAVLNLKDTPWVKLCSANPLGLTKPNPILGMKPPPMIGCKLYDKEKRNLMRKENPAKWEKLLETWKSANARVQFMAKKETDTPLDKFYKEQGCPPIPDEIWGHESPYFNLYLFPKEIDYDQDDDLFQYPPRWFRCDSLIRKSITQSNPGESNIWAKKLSEGMKGKKEMVYFSLGSLASGNDELMKQYIDILSKDQSRLYVVSKGPNGDKYELDSRNMIGGNYIPQTYFLERANLAIVHGGNNSVYECLYYGIPMIVLPVFGDQSDNAQRVEDLGLGRRFDVHNIDGHELLRAIDELLENDAVIQKARSVGENMRSRDTSTKVSRMLKKLLDEKNLDQSFIDLCRDKNVDEIPF